MGKGSVNHIGIATDSLDNTAKVWEALGFTHGDDEVVESQGVKIRYMRGDGETNIELLEPLSADSPVGKFLSVRGPGVQQIAVNVPDLVSKIYQLKGMGIRMINDEPILGSNGHKIAFIHPSSCGGVLVELVEYEQSEL